MSATLQDWANAIFHFEGGNPGDLNVRNNNPGNLRVTNATGQVGTSSGGYAIFATAQDGWNALTADLQAKVRKYPTMTLQQIMGRYAPASDNNNPDKYATFVAGKLGVSVTDTLAAIFGGK